ncbi:hypothetical protein HUJ05_006923 [Dendroctonus ponderosae]|nr:hypothetical protein HUJ05_006923 [Dendroctonus ponderosae]
MREAKDSPDAGNIVEDHRNLLEWTDTTNIADAEHHLPINMQFNDGHRLSIAVYSVLMVFSAIANITVLVLLMKRRRHQPSRINTMLMHLAIADLLVTFLMMPMEIAWAATVEWIAGDAMCRIMSFFRTFGLYLSSLVLCCISIDRYYAVLKPLQFADIDRREKNMIICAWMGAVIFSAPQMIIFHVEHHPNITTYRQCVTYHSFRTPLHELIYSVSADSVTRSSLGVLSKAKTRTLKMTIIIVFVFFVCWTPYHVMCVWYWYDRDSAIHVDPRIQKGLFLFACTNSCANPVVYGIFNIRAKRKAVKVRPRLSSNSTIPRSSYIPPHITAETRLSPLEISLRTATLTINATAPALCAVSATDKSAKLMAANSNRQVDLQRLLRTFAPNQQDGDSDRSSCLLNGKKPISLSTWMYAESLQERGRKKRQYSSRAPLVAEDYDASDVFSAFGTTTITNFQTVTKSCYTDQIFRNFRPGCGEQIMASMAPNLYVLRYLNATGSLPAGLKQKILRNLKLGYQRILNYAHTDGSFSAFGYFDPSGSMFLTTFVVRVLQEAKSLIYVDAAVLDRAVRWIFQHQLENGCFDTMHHVFQDMGGTNMENSTAGLTAYVILSLFDAKVDVPDAVQVNAKYCIRSQNDPDRYSMVISSYALFKVQWISEASRFLEKAIEVARKENEFMWWSTRESDDSSASDIEVSSYALLACLEQKSATHMAYAHSIQTRTDSLDLHVHVTALNKSRGFKIADQDRLTSRQLPLHPLEGRVGLSLTGTGCALAQLTSSYFSSSVSESEAFRLEVEVGAVSTIDQCSIRSISPCLSYQGPGQLSNMAVMELALPSGFQADRPSLYELVDGGTAANIKMFEEKDDQINIYFTSLGRSSVCFTINISENLPVENRKGSLVKLYDYYRPEQNVLRFYSLASTSMEQSKALRQALDAIEKERFSCLSAYHRRS